MNKIIDSNSVEQSLRALKQEMETFLTNYRRALEEKEIEYFEHSLQNQLESKVWKD